MSEASTLTPDRSAMLRHVELVFGGGFDGAQDGLVELAWTDPASGALRNAQMFGTDQLDDLVERAADLNRTQGYNVYIGAALRKPATPPAKRSTDEDFHAAPFAWADIDRDCVDAAIKAAKAAGVPATMTVVTGRHPHMRAQLWWRLVEAERDSAAIKALCSGLGLALGGDSSVSNPGRVLRLGGSIAWPLKPGRVRERTEVHIPKDDRPPAYWPSALAQALAPAATDAPPPAGPADLAIGSRSVEAALADIKAGKDWHDNVVRLVGSWISRGLADAEILALADSLTLPGFTIDQTRRDLVRMIEGGRRKWTVPDPVHIVSECAPASPLAIRWRDGASAAMIPRRRWIIGAFALRGQLTVLVAPPGAGKSTLTVAMAVAAATGRGEIIGEVIHEQVKAWIWNNEDDEPELDRRLNAVMHHWAITPADLRGRLGLNSGSERPLVVARAMKDGSVVRLPDIEAIMQLVKAEGIGLLIVDPFVETHEVNENDNAQIKAVAALWREVARLCDCAVVLVHHTGKPPAASPDAWTGSLSASRGASSLGGVARIMRTLFAMSERDAEKLGLDPSERRLWVRLDDAKANLSLSSGSARWFERVSITIANGEEVGVLVPGDPAERPPQDNRSGEIESALFEAIRTGWHAGKPLSEQPRALDRYAPGIVGKRLRVASETVADVLASLMGGGAIERTLFDAKTKTYGLRIVPLDERDRRVVGPVPDHVEGVE